MDEELDLSNYWCWQEDCPDHGKTCTGNIVLKERYGKDNRALLKCKTCGHCFSDTRGTPFFGLNTSIDEVCRTLALIPEKGSIRGVARASGHSISTVCKVRAQEHELQQDPGKAYSCSGFLPSLV